MRRRTFLATLLAAPLVPKLLKKAAAPKVAKNIVNLPRFTAVTTQAMTGSERPVFDYIREHERLRKMYPLDPGYDA